MMLQNIFYTIAIIYLILGIIILLVLLIALTWAFRKISRILQLVEHRTKTIGSMATLIPLIPLITKSFSKIRGNKD